MASFPFIASLAAGVHITDPSFEEGATTWQNLQRGASEVQAAPHGTAYGVSSAGSAALRQAVGVIESGRSYTVRAWARGINPAGTTADAYAELRLEAGGAALGTLDVAVGVRALGGDAASTPNDDGANVWFDGGFRMAKI